MPRFVLKCAGLTHVNAYQFELRPQTMTMPAKPLSTTLPASASGRPAAPPGPAAGLSIRDLKAHCSTCSLRELCLPVGLDPEDLKQVDALVNHRIKLKKG